MTITESAAQHYDDPAGTGELLALAPDVEATVRRWLEHSQGLTVDKSAARMTVTVKDISSKHMTELTARSEAWLRASGMWLGRIPPSPGDIAVYNWNGGPPDHIGIVETADGDSFTAVEGNTSTADAGNGGEVMRRARTIDEGDGFGRIAPAHSLQT